jgi:nucleotide-binding universal stress UspA family protein
MEARRIVVGHDGSHNSVLAMEWARHEARLRDATLEVVHVYEPAPYAMITKIPEPHLMSRVEASVHAHASDLLEHAVAGIDDVTVEPLLIRSTDPASALTRRAVGAEMLVVGSRGRGGFAGLMLGSVSQKCVQHATCPVVVVRGAGGAAGDAHGAGDVGHVVRPADREPAGATRA